MRRRTAAICGVLGAAALVPPLVASAQAPGGGASTSGSASASATAPGSASIPPSTSGASASASASPAGAASSGSPAAAAPPASSGHGHWVYVDETAGAASASASVNPAAALASTEPPAGPMRGVYEPPSWTWDLNLEGGLKFWSNTGPNAMGFLRARPGVLYIHDPAYLALGPTYEWSPISPATFGVQGEFLYYDLGVWVQLGGLLDTHGLPGGNAAIGWSVLGVEGQYRTYQGLGDVAALYVKLRLPIGILVHALSQRSKHHDDMTGPAR
jgi:hypothetical protein